MPATTMIFFVVFISYCSPVYAQERSEINIEKVWDGEWKAGIEEVQMQEKVSGEMMVFLAYAATWFILFLYVVRLASGLRALRRDIKELERRIEEAGR